MNSEPTPEAPTEPTPLPPEGFTERAAHARARGLAAPYIAGGDDPELVETLRRERVYVRVLLGMIVAIVLSGFVLGAIGLLLGFGSAS